MVADNSSQLTVETRVRGNDVRVVLDRGEQKLGTFLLNNQTICWLSAAAEMTWVMTWEQFSEVMQAIDIGEVVRLSQSAFVSANRIAAPLADASFGFPMPDAREELKLNRRFNTTEFALIRKGFSSDWDAHWGMCFDPARSELRMCRSWTGYCIYAIRFREDSGGCDISESWVNRNPEQCENTNTKHDAEVASYLIDVFLLGRTREFPTE